MKQLKLQEKIENLPIFPGIYMMKDKEENILYVGKSKHLRKRVKSYFYSNERQMNKIKRMVTHIEDIDYIVTDTELEALLLECKMIKKYQPLYNRLMKNEQKYCYLKVTKDKGLSLAYSVNEDEKYYGPFMSRKMVDELINFFDAIMPISYDEGQYDFKYQVIRNISYINEKDQQMHTENICRIIEEDIKKFTEVLEEKMKKHAKMLQFERAKFYQNGIQLLEQLLRFQKFVKETMEQKMILAVEPIDLESFKLFLIQGNQIMYKEKIMYASIENQEAVDLLEKNLKNILSNESMKKNKFIEKESIDVLLIIYNYLYNQQNPMLFIEINEDNKCMSSEVKELIKRW